MDLGEWEGGTSGAADVSHLPGRCGPAIARLRLLLRRRRGLEGREDVLNGGLGAMNVALESTIGGSVMRPALGVPRNGSDCLHERMAPAFCFLPSESL